MPNKDDTKGRVIKDDSIYNKKIKTIPKPEKEIGIDTKNTIYDNIIQGTENSTIDLTALTSFSNSSQNREQVCQLIDMMAEDSTISAILETYAEDATQTNEEGRIAWAESEDPNITKYVQWILDSFNVDKHAYAWMHSLIKYGDLYLKLFRESDFSDDILDKSSRETNKKLNEAFDLIENKKLNEALSTSDDILKEDLKVKVYSQNDKFINFVERVPNPSEIFELTRFGRSYAYIEAPTATLTTKNVGLTNNYYQYSFKKNDVNIYPATAFVHAALEDNSSRTPEKIEIFKSEADTESDVSSSYIVRRGQSILYDAFKVWRILSLLENSLVLNRLTRSSITRILTVEVGSMPKDQVATLLTRIKSMIEQKTSLNVGTSMSEYTNPGPNENIIYVPVHDGIGNISSTDIGTGQVDPGSLADIEYFKNQLFGALKVPKQFFAQTDDSTGFNGGTSLSIISSRYGKTIVRIQNTFIQALTDAVNLLLVDRGLYNYVNKFAIKMVRPITQEDLDRVNRKDTKISMINSAMNLFNFESQSSNYKILKAFLDDVLDDATIAEIIQEEIEKAEAKEKADRLAAVEANSENDLNNSSGDNYDNEFGDLDDLFKPGNETPAPEEDNELSTSAEDNNETELPTPADLGADFTDTENI